MLRFTNSSLVFLILSTLVSHMGHAQGSSADPVIGTEIFVTMDADSGAAPAASDWLRFRFEHVDGHGLQVFDYRFAGIPVTPFPAPPSSSFIPPLWGFGAWGPIYQRGDYLVEPFSLSQSLGMLAGQLHAAWIVIMLPNSSGQPLPTWFPCERSPLIAGQRHGLRFTRLDGQPFRLVSTDYIGAQADFQVGTSLNWYFDFAGFERFSPVIGSTDIETLTFPVGPEPVQELRFDDGPSMGRMIFSPSGSFASTPTSVVSFRRSSGLIVDDPLADPAIAGIVTIYGTYTGSDLVRFSDIQLTSATLTLTSTTGQVLTVTTSYAPGALDWKLLGPLEARPMCERMMMANAPVQMTNSGAGSDLMDFLDIVLAFDLPHLRARMTPAGPQLVGFGRGPLPLPPVAATYNFGTSGAGDLEVGVIDAHPNVAIRHFIQLSPPGALGAGPFFGLDATPEVFGQITLPLGVQPFHVNANAEGTYHWIIGAGLIPAGLVADVVMLQMTAPLITTSLAIRVVF